MGRLRGVPCCNGGSDGADVCPDGVQCGVSLLLLRTAYAFRTYSPVPTSPLACQLSFTVFLLRVRMRSQYLFCSLDPYWRSTTWESTLDCFLAGLVGTSGVFYSLWLYSLYDSGNFGHLSHLGLTVAANGTRIFRLLALSGSMMAWRAVHVQVRQATAVLMQRFGEQLREASAHAAPPRQPPTQENRQPQPNEN